MENGKEHFVIHIDCIRGRSGLSTIDQIVSPTVTQVPKRPITSQNLPKRPTTSVHPLTIAIREELSIVLPDKHTYLTERILVSSQLQRFYGEIGERVPTSLEREVIRHTLARIYGGMLNSSNQSNVSLQSLIQELVEPFYEEPSNKNIRIGCFFSRLKAKLDFGHSKFQALFSVSINTFKNYAKYYIPSTALSRGRNGRMDYWLVDTYLETVI